MRTQSLTSLTPSQLLEVASKKLLKGNYVEIPDGINVKATLQVLAN